MHASMPAWWVRALYAAAAPRATQEGHSPFHEVTPSAVRTRTLSRGSWSQLCRAALSPRVWGEETSMHCDIHRDWWRGQVTRYGGPGHGRRRVQVEIRWGRVAAATCPLCNVIFSAHHRETANCGRGSQDLSTSTVGTISYRMCWWGSAAPASLLNISSVGHFRRNRDYLPK